MTDLRILVIAEDPLARTALAQLLREQPECDVVGQLAADPLLLENLEVYRPDVVVWDLGWDPAVALERLQEVDAAQRLILGLVPDETHAADAWAVGVRGLLPRETSGEALAIALRTVAQGLVVLDPTLATAFLPTQAPEEHAVPVEELTPRELEVLRLLAEGLSNKAIGVELSISEHTVKFHVNAILGKLGAQSRTEAVVRATRLGLILL